MPTDNKTIQSMDNEDLISKLYREFQILKQHFDDKLNILENKIKELKVSEFQSKLYCDFSSQTERNIEVENHKTHQENRKFIDSEWQIVRKGIRLSAYKSPSPIKTNNQYSQLNNIVTEDVNHENFYKHTKPKTTIKRTNFTHCKQKEKNNHNLKPQEEFKTKKLRDDEVNMLLKYFCTSKLNEDTLLIEPTVSHALKNTLNPQEIIQDLEIGSYKNIVTTVNDSEGDDEGEHWSVLVLEGATKKYYHIDSASGFNAGSAEKLADQLDICRKMKRTAPVINIPCLQQQNGSDCGYFTVHNIELDWTRASGWRVTMSRSRCLPGDPGFPQVSNMKPNEYNTRGFENSPI